MPLDFLFYICYATIMNNIFNKKTKYAFYSLGILAIIVFGALSYPIRVSAKDDLSNMHPYGSSEIPVEEEVQDINNPEPSVTLISPKTINLGAGSVTITISGSGFNTNSIARVNGANRYTTFIDSHHLLVQLNASDTVGASGRYITVFNGAPGGGYSNAALLTISGYKTTTTTTPKNPTINQSNINTSTRTNTNNNTYSNNTYTTRTYDNTNTNEYTEENNNQYSDLASNAIFGSNSFAPSGLVQWIFFGILILIIVIIVRKIFGGEDRYKATPMKHA